MRLIDADALLAKLDADPPYNWAEYFKKMVDNAPTIDPNVEIKKKWNFVDPCRDGKEHDWKKCAVSIDTELNTVTTYGCLKCGETFDVKFKEV